MCMTRLRIHIIMCVYIYIYNAPPATLQGHMPSQMVLICLSDASSTLPHPVTHNSFTNKFSHQTFLSHPSSHSFVCKSFTLRPPTYNNSTSSLTLPRYPQPFQCLFSDHISIYIHYCIHQYMRLINKYIYIYIKNICERLNRAVYCFFVADMSWTM